MPRKPAGPRKKITTRYLDRDGRQCRKGTRGARKVATESDDYWATVDGELVNLGTSDLGVAWELFRKLTRQSADEAAGLVPRRDDPGLVPLADRLEEYGRFLAAKGTGKDQIDLVTARLRDLLDLAGWRHARDITDDSLTAAIARLRREPAVGAKGARRERSAQTRNHFRTHAKAFCRWLGRQLGRILLAQEHGKEPVEVDKRHPRRCPTTEEVAVLWAYLASPGAKRRNRMSGPQRAMGYRVCMATGLRAKELRTLTPADLDVAGWQLRVMAAYSKHRREDTQPMPDWLAGPLAEWLAGGGGLWSTFPKKHPGRILKDDLRDAGVTYETADGFLDFHAFRVWYITQLAHDPNIDPATLLALARHSDPRLTLKVYTRAKAERGRAAAARLPEPGRGV